MLNARATILSRRTTRRGAPATAGHASARHGTDLRPAAAAGRPAPGPGHVEDLREGVIVVAPDGKVLSADTRFAEMTGFAREELVGTYPPLPFWPEDEPRAFDAFLAMLTSREEGVVESVARDAHGRRFTVESRWSQVRDDHGDLIAHVVAMRDLTARAELERVLAENAARLASVASGMREGMLLIGGDARITLCNDAACAILGVEKAQLVGMPTADPRWRTVDEDGHDLPGERQPGTMTLRTGVPQRDVVMGVDSPTRGRRWLSVSAVPVGEADDLGRPTATVVTFIDITEDRSNRVALRGERDLTRSVLGAMCEGLMVLDAAGRLVDMNDRLCAMLGCERDDVLGSVMPFAWVPPAHMEAISRAMAGTLEGEERVSVSVEMYTSAGVTAPFSITARRHDGADGAEPGYVLTVRDGTCTAPDSPSGCGGAPAASKTRRTRRR